MLESVKMNVLRMKLGRKIAVIIDREYRIIIVCIGIVNARVNIIIIGKIWHTVNLFRVE